MLIMIHLTKNTVIVGIHEGVAFICLLTKAVCRCVRTLAITPWRHMVQQYGSHAD